MNNKFVCVDETMEKVCLYCVYCKPKFWLLRLSEERQNLLDFKNTLICVAKMNESLAVLNDLGVDNNRIFLFG